MMRKLTKMLIVLITAVLMGIGSQPAFSMGIGSQPTFSYSWSPTPNIADAIDIGGGAKDITGIWYANDGVNKYFRMDLNGVVTSGDRNNLYGIYIGSSSGFTPSTSNLVGGLVFIGSDGTLNFSNVGTPSVGTLGFRSSNTSTTTTLEWTIPGDQLPNAFYYMGATQTLPSTINDTTDIKYAHTPIPNAAWLLGSGVLCLIGLQRRHAKKG